jgi:hypothetical protein
MFKACTMCGKGWESPDALLDDPGMEFAGYQPHFREPRRGLFLFTHAVPGCGSTFAVDLAEFAHLAPDPLPPESLRPGSEGCRGYCLDIREDRVCDNPKCVGNFYRRLMVLVRMRMAGGKRSPQS